MKRSLLIPAVLLCAVSVADIGCASRTRRLSATTPRTMTYALAVTVDGVLQPTPAQFAAIQAKAVEQFSPLGYVLVTDLSLAQRILRVNFIPNPLNPETSGRVTIMGFRDNPRYATAPSMGGSYPTSFGFAGSFSNTNWSALNNFGYGYYGYGNSLYDGYSYSSPNLNPTTGVTPTKRVHPPYRHDSDKCPPEFHRVQPPVRLVSDFSSELRRDYERSLLRDSGHWSRTDYAGGSSGSGSRTTQRSDSTSSWRNRGDGTERGERTTGDSGSRSERTYTRSESGNSRDGNYARSDSGRSRSESGYSRSDPGYSRSEPSHSRSDSGHSRSESSYSRSDSGSSRSDHSGGGSWHSRSEPSSTSSSSSSSSPAPTYSPPSEPSSSSSSNSSSDSGGGHSHHHHN